MNELNNLKPFSIDLPEVSWQRNVLVGCLRDRAQLRACLRHRFYHMPAERLEGDPKDIKWVAIYQSQTLFGIRAGIRRYGRVVDCKLVNRSEIIQIPRDSDTPYYVFAVDLWKKLPKKIISKEIPITHICTTEFLLRNSRHTPELMLEDERQYRLYHALKKLLRRKRIRKAGFLFEDFAVVVKQGQICTQVNGELCPSYLQEHYRDTPYAVFRHILSKIS